MSESESVGTLGPVDGVYSIFEKGSDEQPLPFGPESLVLVQDGDRIWGHIDLDGIEAIFLAPERPREAFAGETRTLCRCRVRGADGAVSVYDGGAGPAPHQWISFLGNGEMHGRVRFGERERDWRRFVALRVDGGRRIGVGRMRDMWEDIVSGE